MLVISRAHSSSVVLRHMLCCAPFSLCIRVVKVVVVSHYHAHAVPETCRPEMRKLKPRKEKRQNKVYASIPVFRQRVCTMRRKPPNVDLFDGPWVVVHSIPPPPITHTSIVAQNIEDFRTTSLYTPDPLNRFRNAQPVQSMDVVHIEYHADQPRRIHSTTGVLIDEGRHRNLRYLLIVLEALCKCERMRSLSLLLR
jgi:hypothetical protein